MAIYEAHKHVAGLVENGPTTLWAFAMPTLLKKTRVKKREKPMQRGSAAGQRTLISEGRHRLGDSEKHTWLIAQTPE